MLSLGAVVNLLVARGWVPTGKKHDKWVWNNGAQVRIDPRAQGGDIVLVYDCGGVLSNGFVCSPEADAMRLIVALSAVESGGNQLTAHIAQASA